jgi:hypothetical protein
MVHKAKNKVNKSLKDWVAFVKKVQNEEKCTYSEAMKHAKRRKDRGEKWMSGGAGVAQAPPQAQGTSAAQAPPQAQGTSAAQAPPQAQGTSAAQAPPQAQGTSAAGSQGTAQIGSQQAMQGSLKGLAAAFKTVAANAEAAIPGPPPSVKSGFANFFSGGKKQKTAKRKQKTAKRQNSDRRKTHCKK